MKRSDWPPRTGHVRLVQRVRLALVGALLAPLALATVLLGASFFSISAGAVTFAGHMLNIPTTVGELSMYPHDGGGTLFVVPDNQVITYSDALPNYTFTYHEGSPAGPVVTPTLTAPPTCTSGYDGSWNVGSYAGAITCSAGSDTTTTLDVSSSASLTINKATLFVVPDALTVVAKTAAPAYTFSFHAGSATGPQIPVTVASPPSCSSNYTTAVTTTASPLTIYCWGGSDPNVTFNDTSTALLTIAPPHLKAQAPLHLSARTGIAGVAMTLQTTGGSGAHVTSYVTKSPQCVVRGDQLTYTGGAAVAHCSVVATNAKNGAFLAARSAPTTMSFGSFASLHGQSTVTRFCGPPNTPIANCQVTITVGQYPAQLQLSAWVDGDVLNATVAETSATGSTTLTLTLPSTLAVGAHRVSVGLVSGTQTSVAGFEDFTVAAGSVLGHIGAVPSGPLGQYVQYVPSQHRKEILATAVGTVAAVGAAAGAMGGAGASRSGESGHSAESSSSGETGNLGHSSIRSFLHAKGARVETEAILFASAVVYPSRSAPSKLATMSPMVARVAIDGEYLRAVTGAAWFALNGLALALGVACALNTHFYVLPPALPLFALVFGLSILDAWLGLLAGIVFVSAAVITGHLQSFGELRLAAGLLLVWFSVPMAAATVRPLRRKFVRSVDGLWNHAADIVVSSLFGAWVAEKLVTNLSGISGVELPIVQHKASLALLALVLIALRIVVESLVLERLPHRLAAVHYQGRLQAPLAQQMLSLTFQIGLLVFLAQAFLGVSWALVLGTVLYFSPLVPKPFEKKLPKSRRLAALVPIPLFKYSTVVLIGAAISILLQLTIHSTSTMTRVAFIVLPLPNVFFWHVQLWAAPKGESPTPASVPVWRRSPWFLRLAGTVLFAGAVFVVLNHIGA